MENKLKKPAKQNDRIWRVIDILKWGESYFKTKGFENPKKEIEWFLCDLLKYKRIDLYVNFEDPIPPTQLDQLKGWIKRRCNHEPIQYITGSTEFYGLKLNVTPHVLIPRPETERLVDVALHCIGNYQAPKILEVGAGSGCIPIAIASEKPKAKILSLDVSKDALTLSRQNAKFNDITNIDFVEMDFLFDIPKGQFDLLVSNPPYIPKNEIENLMPEVKKHEPRIALTDNADGMTFYRRFADVVKSLVKNGGWIVLEIGLGDHPNKVFTLFKESGFNQLEIIQDFNSDERVLKIQI